MINKNEKILRNLENAILALHCNDSIVDTIFCHNKSTTAVEELIDAYISLGGDFEILEEMIGDCCSENE